ncbi:MAG TPA: sulfite exporter TauE/SafE family protein [Gaiellaceae bacterium]|nr:sulfite exporter TauE/SafE family protein [Gaiellaceae bacterium]
MPDPRSPRMTWQYIIAGLAVGTLVGMTGMGGGSLMTPMLILIFGFDPKTAVGTDILHGAVFKSFGAWRHRQLGNVHTRLALWMLAGSGPLSLVGVQLADSFSDSTQSAMGKVVGGSLILGGLGFFAKTFLPRSSRPDEDDFAITTRVRVIAILIGATFGFIVGLTSVGSGTFFGLALLLLFPLSATRMVGTDMLHAALLLWIAGAGHLIHGNVDLHAIAWLLIGSIPGVLLGSHLSIRVPDRALRVAFAFVLVLSGIKLVKVPAADTIIEAGLAVGAVVFIAWGVRTLQQRRAFVPAAD